MYKEGSLVLNCTNHHKKLKIGIESIKKEIETHFDKPEKNL